MNRITRLTAALAVTALLAGASRASAAPTADRPVRVATVNMPRVFNQIQEAVDIQARLRQDQAALVAERKGIADNLEKLKNEGGNYRKGSPQYADWRQRYVKATINLQAWEATAKQELDWRLKQQTRDIFDKIVAAVSEYATSNQIDLVLTDHQPTVSDEELEKIPAEQISAVMDRRRVIYASKNADISDAIIASLDAKYKAGGGAQGPIGQGPLANPNGQAADAGTAGANLRGNEGAGTGPRRSNNR